MQIRNVLSPHAAAIAAITLGLANQASAHQSPGHDCGVGGWCNAGVCVGGTRPGGNCIVGCTANGPGSSINFVFDANAVNVKHGDEICFRVAILNTCAGCCDITLLDTELVMPDGTIKPMTVDASVPFGSSFTCPSADPRCATPSNCTLPQGQQGYKYIMDHADEHGHLQAGCPPNPPPGSVEVSAFLRSTAGTVHTAPLHGFANICQTGPIPVGHACCEPCTGTCTNVLPGDCAFPSVFTPDKSCDEVVCEPLDCSGFVVKCNDAWCNPATGRCELFPDPVPGCPTEATILSINRWWAYTGLPIPVDLTLWIEQAGAYTLDVDIDDTNSWDLTSGAYVTVDNGSTQHMFNASGAANLGTLARRVHTLHLWYFQAPLNPIIERIRFQLQGPQSATFDAMFVADRKGISEAEVALADFQDSEGTPLLINSVQDLVDTFAPRLYFDSLENYFPQSVEATLSDGAILLDASDVPLPFDGTVNGLFEASATIGSGESLDSLWLDLPGQGPTEAGSGDPNDPFPIYASAILKDNQLAISYYIHYGYSNWRQHDGYNNHEGDWESAFVYLQRATVGQPFMPVKVAYSQHEKYGVVATGSSGSGGVASGLSGGEWAAWSDLIRARLVESHAQLGAKTHAKLFVGLGGHASYFSTDNRSYPVQSRNEDLEFCSGHGRYFEYFDGKLPNDPEQSTTILLPRAPDANNSTFSWLLYPGRWGQKNLPDLPDGTHTCASDGPLGPVFSTIKSPGTDISGQRWFDPINWLDAGLESFDHFVPDFPSIAEQPVPAQDTSGVKVELDHLWEWSDADDRFKEPDDGTVTINPNAPTYLLTHGWDGTLDGVDEGTACVSPTWAMSSIGCALREAKPDANILAWDWKVLANPNRECDFPDELLSNPGLLLSPIDIQRNPPTNAVLFDAWNSAVNVAVEGNKLGKALADELSRPGGTLGTELHLIGKSHGGGVMGRTAKIMKGKGSPPNSLSTLDTPKVGTINSLRWVEPDSVADDGQVAVYYYDARARGGMGAPVPGNFANLTNLSLNEWFVPALSVAHLWISGPDDLVCPAVDGWYPLSAWYHTLEFTGMAIVPSVLSPIDMPGGCFAEGEDQYKLNPVTCGSTAGAIAAEESPTAGLSLMRYEPFQSAASWSGNLVELAIGADTSDPANRVVLIHEEGDASFFKDIEWPTGSVFLTFDYVFGDVRGKESLTVYIDDQIIYYDSAETTLAIGQLTLSDALYVGGAAGTTARLNFVLRTDGTPGGGLVLDNIRVYGFLEHDADFDGDRDLFDFAAFQRCFSPGVPPNPECERFDASGSEGVDLADWAGLRGALTGPLPPSIP